MYKFNTNNYLYIFILALLFTLVFESWQKGFVGAIVAIITLLISKREHINNH
ncbi:MULTISPECIES: hypothetical protein [Vagococcus]|uniref:hypothetical protein n=1 Tax=Vagococcus TaxID=2737 RepID=UPI002FC675FB